MKKEKKEKKGFVWSLDCLKFLFCSNRMFVYSGIRIGFQKDGISTTQVHVKENDQFTFNSSTRTPSYLVRVVR